MKLSILDQSPITTGATAASAIADTLQLARAAEQLGYYRYWVSEHHSTNAFASASPEILLGRIAADTTALRVGTGGVLLGHYSPYKVAEQFALLETLYPGRVDLGIGRAPGGDGAVVRALRSSASAGDETFAKLDEMIAHLEHSRSRSQTSARVMPSEVALPELWVLGTSPQSAAYAAERGLRYSFGSFINPQHCVEAIQTYYQKFQSSRFLDKPCVNLAVYLVCAATEAQARQLAQTSELWFVRSFLHGKNVPFPTLAEAEEYTYRPQEQFMLDLRRQSVIIGDPQQTVEQLKTLARQLAVTEFTIVTIPETIEQRVESYRLLAEAWGLEPRTTGAAA